MKKRCPICEKVFYDTPARIKKRVTCSIRCHNKRIKTGIKQTKESNQKRREALKGKKCYAWKGGRTFHHSGYVYIYCPNHPYAIDGKYIREHRLVMEEHLSRYLLPQEVVHHINSNVEDNRIENLKLFSSKKEHSKFHKS